MNKYFGTVVLIGLVYVGGCASTVVPPGPQPLSEYHRKQLGNVLVTPNYESDEITSGINPGKGGGLRKERVGHRQHGLAEHYSRATPSPLR